MLTKWKKTFEAIMKDGMSMDNINGPICKDKWNIIFGNLKFIHDNMKSTWHN